MTESSTLNKKWDINLIVADNDNWILVIDNDESPWGIYRREKEYNHKAVLVSKSEYQICNGKVILLEKHFYENGMLVKLLGREFVWLSPLSYDKKPYYIRDVEFWVEKWNSLKSSEYENIKETATKLMQCFSEKKTAIPISKLSLVNMPKIYHYNPLIYAIRILFKQYNTLLYDKSDLDKIQNLF